MTDLEVRHGDLIASTEGRAFWILDDLSVIRQHADSLASAAAHLYQPRTALLVGGGGGFGGGAGANMVGRNPRSGAVINYRLASAPDSATSVRLEFLDSKGAVVRSYSTKEGTGPSRLASVANLLVTRIGEIHDAVLRVRDLKTQVQGFVTRTKDADSAKAIGTMGGTIVKKLETADPKLTTKAQNGQDIINYANGINGQYGFLLGQVEGNPVLTQGVKERLAELERLWRTLRTEVETIENVDIAAFNKLLQASKVEGVIGKKKPGTVM
ncbi:MAG: hypothetical protein IPJ56_02220 [Gemmatimonadetes bacterium]|nr:hypothetical protein [Gemmatimonadota bacterium]